MKKNILLILFAFITCFVFTEELHLKKIIKAKDDSYRFLDKNILYLCTSDSKFYYYDFNKIDTMSFPFTAEKCLLQNDVDNNLILGLSNEIFEEFSLDFFKFYKVDIFNKILNPIDSVNFLSLKRKTLPSFLRNLHYLDYYLYAPIKEYCLIVKDVQGHGIEINELHPEKHAYHDMDLVLIDKKGNVCSVLPFTFDDQTASKEDYVEVSADGKYIKIFASSGYILGHIDESLVVKYPELDDGPFYFIYEIVPDNTPYENTEVLDFRYDLEVNEEILIKSEFKDCSAFNVKIKEEFNEKNKQGIINDTRVRLRSEPNLSCETLGYLEKGDAVKIVDRSDEKFEIDGENWYWYQVETTDEQTGWVYGKYLDIENE